MTSPSGEGPPACPVCGAPIEADLRQCAKCETPHHADCWSYAGRCAVYACMGVTVMGDLPVPLPAAPLVIAAAPAPGALSLAASAARVPPIVPVPGHSGRHPQCWSVDDASAWMGPRDGSIRPAPGERVVVLGGLFLTDVRLPEDDARMAKLTFAIGTGVAGALVCAGGVFLTGLLMFKVSCGACASVVLAAAGALPEPPAERLWLTVGRKGTWVHGLRSGRPFDFPVEGPSAPRCVRLTRAYESPPAERERSLLTYRLVLEWALGREAGSADGSMRELAPPVQMPETAEARRPVLEQLVACRALGEHVAALLGIPFVEGLRPS